MNIADEKIEPGIFTYYVGGQYSNSVINLVNSIIGDIEFKNAKQDSNIICERILKLPINEQLYVIYYLIDNEFKYFKSRSDDKKRTSTFDKLFIKNKKFELHYDLLAYFTGVYNDITPSETLKYEEKLGIKIDVKYLDYDKELINNGLL